MTKLAISGIDITVQPVVRIDVDDYVPLSFRSYAFGLGGVRDVRLGDLSSNFLELKLGLDSNTLRGITLLRFGTTHELLPAFALREEVGLPILNVNEAHFEGPWATQCIDLPMAFSVAVGTDCVEIDFGMLFAADRASVFGPVKFFLNGDSLVGIRVFCLTREQLKKIQEMRSD
ncbi:MULTISPECIES: hypothetical protein [Variovorax]|uniref:hypothetical protein n=1 Tax=Variovorax TaxID=34072 RepID=UPI00285D0B34|nr:hypothetical protein [Variovorax sp. 3319]MDR6891029.1 hypothetical protein [Variovorax sp. 3319]